MMKHLLYILPLLSLLSFTSCINDDSTLANKDVSDITVKGIEGSYTVLSYSGEKVDIQPTIETSYSDMEYHWYLYDSKGQIETDGTGDAAGMKVLSNTKDLSYEVDLPEGNYGLYFKATSKSNDYTIYKRSELVVTTEFVRGTYILKEDADGNTDMDLYTPDGVLMPNVLSKTQGEAMKGAPLAFSLCFNMGYILNNVHNYSNMMYIATKDNQFKFIRISDLKCIFDRSSFSFATIDDDEVGYATVTGIVRTMYFSNKGIRNVYTGAMSYTSGKFGDLKGAGSSPFIVAPHKGSNMIFWDGTSHAISLCSALGTTSKLAVNASAGTNVTTDGLTDYECIASGQNYIGTSEIIYFILQNKAGERFLYTIKMVKRNTYNLTSVLKLDSNLNLSKAKLITTNGSSATYIYCINNSKLYAYNMADGTETELAFTGIPSGEQITYCSCQYWTNPYDGNYSFSDKLVIGTQSGTTYKLYYYNTLGGKPNGSPYQTITGTGIFKKLNYASPADYRFAFDYQIWN
jgi:hypothetical protein